METPSTPTPEKPLHFYKFLPEETQAPNTDASQDQGDTMMIRRIAADTVAAEVTPEQQETDEYGLPVKEMVGVLGYCFVRDVYCSKDIAELLKNDPALRKRFGRKLPDEQALRRFRRQFSKVIESTLGTLYRAEPALAPTPPAPSDEAGTEYFKRQAADRVHDAAWADNTKGRLG